MTRRVYLYFCVTFILGSILGGLGVYYFLWNTGRLTHRGGFDKNHAITHLKTVLNLSDAQIQQLGQIFDESVQKTRDLQKQVDPQFQAIHMETRARIRQILNPDQAKKFDELTKEIDARHRHDGPPPPH